MSDYNMAEEEEFREGFTDYENPAPRKTITLPVYEGVHPDVVPGVALVMYSHRTYFRGTTSANATVSLGVEPAITEHLRKPEPTFLQRLAALFKRGA